MDGKKLDPVHDLASVMFGIGVDVGREILREIDEQNRQHAKQDELRTEGRIYPRRRTPHDE